MSALPRPDLPPGPHRELNDALHQLHHRAGWPSLRRLAADAGCSHTTVSKAFSTAALPSWGTLELLVEAMQGDTARFHDLWLAGSSPSISGTPPTPQIAGRRAELAAVRRHLETGTGLLLVTGEAGMGKTKLVTTAAELAGPDIFVATGSCLPLSTAVAMLPVADALQRLYERDEGQWLKEALADSAPYVAGSIRRLVPDVERLLNSGPQPEDDWSRQRLFAAVAATLKSLSAVRPLGLVIEDLHWGDAATLDLIEHLSARGLKVPVVGSFRTDDPTTLTSTVEWFGRVRRLPSTAVIALNPLSQTETAEQLALVLGRTPAPGLVATVHGRSRGLPLFTEQLAGSAEADQPLPELLADLLEARLVGLGSPAWTVARILGVADRALPDSVVRHAGGLSAETLVGGLRELADRLLLAPADGQDVVQLRHPLLAEAIRRRLVAGESTEHHRRLAITLAATPDPAAAEIATHWSRAGDRGEEVTWRVAAARAAEARFSSKEALEQWQHVIDLHVTGPAGSDGPALAEAYCAAIDATWDVGLLKDSVRLTRDALTAAAELDGKPRADVYFRAGARSMGALSPDRCLALVDEAISIYRRLPLVRELPHALARRSAVLGARGRWDEAAADIREAADICVATGDVTSLRLMRAEQAWQEAMVGNRDTALRRIADASAVPTEGPDPTGDVRLCVVATDILLKCGGSAQEVVAAASQGMAAIDTWGASLFGGALLRSNMSEALRRAGDVAAAAALIDPASEEAILGDLWPIQIEKAALDAARGWLEAAANLARKEHNPGASLMHRIDTVSTSASIDLWLGEPRTALAALLDLLDEAAPTHLSRFVGTHLVLAAQAAADVADLADLADPASTDRARRRAELSERLTALPSGMPAAPFGSASVMADAAANEATWRAELSRLMDARSVTAWISAASAWDRLARPHDAAYCRWRAAQAALRDGQGTVAARLLKRAATDAREHVPLSRAIAETAAGLR